LVDAVEDAWAHPRTVRGALGTRDNGLDVAVPSTPDGASVPQFSLVAADRGWIEGVVRRGQPPREDADAEWPDAKR